MAEPRKRQELIRRARDIFKRDQFRYALLLAAVIAGIAAILIASMPR